MVFRTQNEAYFAALEKGLVAVIMNDGSYELKAKWKAEKEGHGPWIIDKPQVEEIFDEVGETLGYKLLP